MNTVEDNIARARSTMEPGAGLQPLFDALAEDVVLSVTVAEGTPISGEFRGRDAVIQYFETLGEVGEFDPFVRPLEYFASGNRVVILGEERFNIKKTGASGSTDFAFVYDFLDGLVTRLLFIEDTSAIADAYRSG